MKKRIQKARQAFLNLSRVWSNRGIREKTKIRIFNSNVKSILLYGSETWRINKSTLGRLQAFKNRCLRRIINIHWPETISNKNLLERTKQEPIEYEVTRRKWRWIGHTLRKSGQSVTRESLQWNPQGQRKRGRPRMTWRRETDAEMRKTGRTWHELEGIAEDRRSWKVFVDGLCSAMS